MTTRRACVQPGASPLPLNESRPPVKPPRIGVNRRDLLRRRRRQTEAFESTVAGTPERGGPGLIRAHRPAMGSYFEVRLPATTPGAVELAYRALDLIDTL